MAAKDPLKYARRAHDALCLKESLEAHDVIQFEARSKNVPVGFGKGERIATGSSAAKYNAFIQLDGRRVLSNMCPSQISVDGVMYPSVEHAFHAGKALLIGNEDIAARFAIDGEYGDMTPKEARSAGRHNIPMSDDALTEWNGSASADRMEKCIRARFAVDARFRDALRATRRAILVHQTRGNQDVRLTITLHTIRSELFH